MQKIEEAVSLVRNVANYDEKALKTLNQFKIDITSESDLSKEYHQEWEEYYRSLHFGEVPNMEVFKRR